MGVYNSESVHLIILTMHLYVVMIFCGCLINQNSVFLCYDHNFKSAASCRALANVTVNGGGDHR